MTVDVFAPLRIGPMKVPNRLALAPVKTALGGCNAVATARHGAYSRRRAEGGVGLIILEPASINRRQQEHPRQLATDDKVHGGLGIRHARSLGRFDPEIVAAGHRSHDPLSDALRDAGLHGQVTGDAHQNGKIFDAMGSGRQAVVAAATR